MIKVRNNQTGQIEEISENQVAEAVASGIYSVQQGVKLPVISPDGKPGTIDSGEAYTAFQSGFTYDTQEQQEERRKEETFGNRPFSASALGVARSLSFGLSDQALTKSGLVESETLREIKERNPELSTAGEIAGVVAPAFVTGGSSLVAKGATSAVRGASTAGRAVESSVAKVLSKHLAAQGETTLAKKVLLSAGSKATGSAVEGAFYGAGHVISEDALGNADLNAETLLANVGVGALVGGAAGAALGTGVVLASESAKAASKLAEPAKPFLRRLLGAKDLPEETSILASLHQKKHDVDALRQAANELEVKLTTGAESANTVVRDAEAVLNETPLFWGEKVKQQHESARKGFQVNAEKVLAEAGEKTEKEVGEQIKEQIVKSLRDKHDPFKIAYEEIRKHVPHVEIDQKLLYATSNRIGRLGGQIGSKGGEVAKYTEQKSLLLTQQQTVDDLTNLASEVKAEGRAFSRAGNDRMAFAAREVGRSLDRLKERALVRQAAKLARQGAPETAEASRSLIRLMRNTNKEYAEFMQFIGSFGKEAKLGRGNYRQIVEKIEDLSPEEVTRKFFNLKDTKSLEFMKANFPDQFEELRRLELAKISSKVAKEDPIHGASIDIPGLIREYNKVPEHLRVPLFGKSGARTIENIEKVYPAFPKTSNPSRTNIREDLSRILSQVLHVRDLAMAGILKWADSGSKEAMTIRGVQGLAQIEKSQASMKKTVEGSIKKFLKTSKKVSERMVDRIPAVTTNAIMDTSFSGKRRKSDDSLHVAFDKRAEEISYFAANPEQFAEKLAKNTAILGTVAPKTSAALQMKTMKAMAFLHSKMPSNPAAARSSNLSIRKWQPSTVELKKFERYMRAVQKPVSVLEDFENGRLTREGVETLKVVYPEIYSQVIREVHNQIVELREELPYKKRLLIGNLLDVPVDLAQEPDMLLALQSTYRTEEDASQANSVRPTSKSMREIDLASQSQTEAQRIASRS